jgi:hypothetical protein
VSWAAAAHGAKHRPSDVDRPCRRADFIVAATGPVRHVALHTAAVEPTLPLPADGEGVGEGKGVDEDVGMAASVDAAKECRA